MQITEYQVIILKISALIFLSEHYLRYRSFGYGVMSNIYLIMPDISAYSISSPYKAK
jgi:hypothetical protein